MNNFPRRLRGVTLIELMFVVTIAVVLASVALPSYLSHIERARRAEGRAVLLEAAQYMQRYYSAKDTYADAKLPARLKTAPPGADAKEKRYDLTVTADNNSFTVTATPVRADDSCGALTLTHTGARSRTGTGLSVAECWR